MQVSGTKLSVFGAVHRNNPLCASGPLLLLTAAKVCGLVSCSRNERPSPAAAAAAVATIREIAAWPSGRCDSSLPGRAPVCRRGADLSHGRADDDDDDARHATARYGATRRIDRRRRPRHRRRCRSSFAEPFRYVLRRRDNQYSIRCRRSTDYVRRAAATARGANTDRKSGIARRRGAMGRCNEASRSVGVRLLRVASCHVFTVLVALRQ